MHLLVGCGAALVASVAATAASTSTFSWSLHGQGSPVYTAPKAFPTSEFRSMYFTPKAQEAIPRPVVTDVDGQAFPDSLNDPDRMPTTTPSASGVLPAASSSSSASKDEVRSQVASTIRDQSQSKCDRCKQALRLGESLARAHPEVVPGVLIDLC